MNLLLITLILASIFNDAFTAPAPAISSVHVSFVSGNKATQYSHGSGGERSIVHYNLLSSPTNGGTGDHILQKRSITNPPQRKEHRRQSVTATYEPITITSSSGTVSPIPIKIRMARTRFPMGSKYRKDYTTTTPTDTTTFNPTNPTNQPEYDGSSEKYKTTTSGSIPQKRMRTRVRFVDSTSKPLGISDSTAKATDLQGHTVTPRMSGDGLLPELTTTTADTLKAKYSKKPKDSKAVKRSPFISENFESGGITFPDFDEFGGNEFGSLRNFGGNSGGGGSGSLGLHTHSNPESLSPDGVFLPPLPTEASDYENSDPYLADPDTAKYAAQHPPFFAAYPHKRAVLALNDQREANGLEPNILRSIRPYFAFFEAANPYSHYQHNNHISDSDVHAEAYRFPATSYADTSNEFFPNLNPNYLLYAETANQPQSMVSSWSIFSNK